MAASQDNTPTLANSRGIDSFKQQGWQEVLMTIWEIVKQGLLHPRFTSTDRHRNSHFR